MLSPPSAGFLPSVKTHNVELDRMAEWLEGCVTFVDDEVTMNEVKDVLMEEGLYRSQDFAQERIDDAWVELKRRWTCLGNVGPYRVNKTKLVRTRKWDDAPAYAFCLTLGLQVAYRRTFLKRFKSPKGGIDYTEQGELFERLTAEALQQRGWVTHSTGWSHAASDSVEEKIELLADHLGEPAIPGAVPRWTQLRAKDAGLDVVCHVPFPDGWAGRPLYFVQCASGENWREKRHTPDLRQWEKLIDFTTAPRRGLAHPFVVLEDAFRRYVNHDGLALVLDRHRLCRPVEHATKDWISLGLSEELNAWTRKRLAAVTDNICQ